MRLLGWALVLFLACGALFFVLRAAARVWIGAQRGFKQYRTVSVEDLPVWLQRLLKRGSDGDFLVITDPATERFVQLRKYIHSPRADGLSFDFPRAPWSERYYDELKTRLESSQTAFTQQPTLDHPVTEFLQVDCGRDLNMANELVRTVLFEVFQLPAEARVRVTD